MPALSPSKNRRYVPPAERRRNARSRARSKPKPKPPPRQPTQQELARARAQEKQYESQGKAVKRQAGRQKRAATRRRARAQERSYESQGRAVKRRAGELGRETRRQQRSQRNARKVSRAVQRILSTGAGDSRERRGRKVPGATVVATGGSGSLGAATRLPRAMGVAFAEDPVGTTKATGKGFKDMAVGIPGAVVETAVDTYEGTKEGDPLRGVKKQGKAYVEDLKRRYGPLMKEGGVRKAAERMKKEGVAPEIVDAVTLAAGPGGAASRGAGALARRGQLGEGAKRTATEPRRRQRTSGGEAAEQPLSRAFFKARRQKRRDERAYRGIKRHVDRADARARRREKTDPRGRPTKGRVDAVVREAAERGEVVPTRLTVTGRRTPAKRKIAKRQRVGFAREQARTLQAIRNEQRSEGISGAGRGAGRLYAGLDANEKRAYKTALQLGVTKPAAGLKVVRDRIALIQREIEEGRADPAEARELRVLHKIASNPEAHFTPKLAAIVREERERGKRVAEADARLGDTVEERARTAELRRRKPQFMALGHKREGTPIREAEAAARERRDVARGELGKAQRAVEMAERAVGRQGGRARLLHEQNIERHQQAVVKAESAVAQHLAAARRHEQRAQRARSNTSRAGHMAKAQAALERAEKASRRRDDLLEHGPKKTRKAEARAAAARERLATERERRDAIREEVKEAAKEGRALRAARRRGDELDPRTAESIEDFLARGIKEADLAGLVEPAFFKSAPRETVLRSLFTVGGSRGVQRDRAWRGRLFATGREDGSFTTYAQGLARNVKAKFTNRLILDSVDEHALTGRGEVPLRGSVEDLRRQGEALGYDPDSWVPFNPGIFREAGDVVDEGGAVARLGDDEQILKASGEDAFDAAAEGDAVVAEAVRLARDTGRFGSSRDWVMMPKGVMDEIVAGTNPSGWFGRGLEVFKGKQARILLGTSPAWLQFQIASNALLSTMAGVGPLEIVRMNVLWRKLTPEQKAELEPLVGVGHFHDSRDQVRLGSAANNGVVNGWRAFKAHPFWHKPRKGMRGGSVSQLNPLDALFRVDTAQNNAFRRAVLLNRTKREAYRRMGENVGVLQRVMDRVLGKLGILGRTQPGRGQAFDKAFREVLGDRKALERGAEAVRDFLGDYMTYSARERRYLGRSVMFYGFLRFSLRFAFYTMPAKHPVMAGVLGQLGRMQTEEVRKLLGGDELPWALGKFYYSRGGELRSVNIARANPFLNTLTEMDPSLGFWAQTRNALRLLPPFYTALANQAFAKSSFRQRDWLVEGETTGRAWDEYGDGTRTRIFANEMLRLVALYRAADVASQGGVPHGDDSMLGDRPTQYKAPKIRAGVEESRRRFEDEGGALGLVAREVVPFLGEAAVEPEMAARVREKKAAAEPAPVVDYSDPAQRRAAIERAKKAAESVGAMTPEERRAAIARAKAAAP